MQDATVQRLDRTDVAIGRAKSILSAHGYRTDERTVMFIGFVSQAIEDHESMSLLCRSDRFGSAFKLARSTFDCLYRGVWLGSCATDDQIKSYIASDKFPVKMTQMAQDIDRHYSSAGSDEDFSWTSRLVSGRPFPVTNTQGCYR